MGALRRVIGLAAVITLLCVGQAWGAVAPTLKSAPAKPVVIPAGPALPWLGHVPAPVPGFDAPRGFSYSPLGRTYASSFDLRTLGKVSAVKNQNPHGTCWAFASVASTESCLLPGESWDFSEDSLAYWHGFDWGYEDGGNSWIASAVFTRWGGPISEADDPYNDSLHPNPSGLTVRKHVQNIVYLPARTSATDNDSIKYALTTWGAVDCSMQWEDARYNSSTTSYYYSGTLKWNHDVTIVGWDDNYAASNFAAMPGGNGAFLVKNSWGAGWGSSGYFWLSYYDTAFGYDTGSAVFRGAEANTNYAAVYQYDPLGNSSAIGYGASIPIWGANRFVASSAADLTALGFWTNAPSTAYQIYYGTSLAGLVSKGSGTFTEMGYHTVPLSTPASLTNGAVFFVAVKLTNSYAYPLAIESRYVGYTSGASASPNQSFYSGNGTSFTDLTSYETTANVCLKAYTASTAPPVPVITAPNGGESWQIGDAHNVTWTGTDGGTATIALSRDGGSTYPDTIVSGTANDGSYSWTVSGPATANAKVRITTTGGNDASNANFTIADAPPPPAPVVTSPNGGESWQIGDAHNVTWTGTDGGTATIALSRDGGSTYPDTIVSGTANDGSYSWTVSGPATANAKVRITTTGGNDASDSAFAIADAPPPPVPVVTAPNGGESWQIGAAHNVTWTGTSGGTATIELSRDGGSTYPDTIVSGTANDGSYSWTVTGPETTQGVVRVTTAGGNDASNASFTITAATPLPGGWEFDPQPPGISWLEDVSAPDAQHAWAVGWDGKIVRTANGGSTWTEQSSGTSDSLYGVAFVDTQRGWAVGASGLILHTTNGGVSWARQTSGTTSWFMDVDFVSPTTGWAVAWGGVWRTTDAGLHWKHQTTGLANADFLEGIDFIDQWLGWVVGDSGEIYRTVDGGLTWSAQTSGLGSDQDLYSVCFTSPLVGWAITYPFYPADATVTPSLVVHTTDGGSSWQQVSVGATAALEHIEFMGTERGWLVGYDAIYSTTDAGTTWQQATTPGYAWLSGVDVVDETTGWAVGGSARILHLTPGGGDQSPPHTTLGGVDDAWHNAPVDVTLSADDASGVASTGYSIDGGPWILGSAFQIGASNGAFLLTYGSEDTVGNVESCHTAVVRIDTSEPITTAPSRAAVRRGRYATLKYRVDDGTSGSQMATVIIRVRKNSRVVKTLKLGLKPDAKTLAARFRCKLAPGTYKFTVYATDLAGNTQLKAGYNRLVVRR